MKGDQTNQEKNSKVMSDGKKTNGGMQQSSMTLSTMGSSSMSVNTAYQATSEEKARAARMNFVRSNSQES